MPPIVLLAQNKAFDPADVELALESLGWQAVVCTSASAACELVRTQEFQFVLLGLTFDDGDGYRVASCIRQSDGPGRKTIIVATSSGTSNITAEETDRCIHAGIDGIIDMRCGRDELTAQLQKWLAKLAFQMWKTEGMPRVTFDRLRASTGG